jgi:hypothetical protein
MKINEVTTNMRTLMNLTHNVSNEIHSCYGSFENTCDLAVSKLANVLQKNNIHGYIVNGEYEYKDGVSDGWKEGHQWLVVNTYIVDPTRGQFDDGEIISKDFSQYHQFNIIEEF